MTPGVPPRDDFFAVVPRSATLVFFAAVFFTFAPVALLLSSSLEPHRAPATLLWCGLISGLLAFCWAAAFTLSRWFVAGIVVFTFAIMAFSGPFRNTALGFGSGRPSLAAAAVVTSVVAGYVLFIVFISGQGRRTVRLLTEMSLAADIHRTLVPAVEFANDDVEALGISHASTEMGGDLVDVVDGPGRTDLFLADVSGHGVRAGVVMGMVKSALRMGLAESPDLGGLVVRLNDVLEATTSPALFATLAALRIDRAGGRAEFVLAGHHPILHHRAGSSRIERLEGRALPLGMMPGTAYETRDVTLGRGDLLALYTDGLNETVNADDEELGHVAIERCLLRHADRPLREIRSALLDEVSRHGAQNDDRTLLLVRVR